MACEKTPAFITCGTCNITKYCSEACMQKDIPGHNIICNADYSQMLRAYCEHLKTFKMPKLYLSYPMDTKLIINSQKCIYSVGLSGEFFCICCKKHGTIELGGGTNESEGVRLQNHDVTKIYYSRCAECYDKDARICPLGYVNTKLCWRGLAGLMILREFIATSGIPSELFSYILVIVNNVSCKQHLMM